MGESQELYASVNHIKNKVDVLEKIELLSLSSNSDLRKKYEDMFEKDRVLYQVYNEIDGFKSQKEIAFSIGKSEPTVSKKIEILFSNALIELKEVGMSGRKIYKYSVAEQVFKFAKNTYE